MKRFILLFGLLLLPSVARAQALIPKVQPSVLLTSSRGIEPQERMAIDVAGLSEPLKTWAIPGLVLGAAVGIAFCATDGNSGNSCWYKIPIGAVGGLFIGSTFKRK